MAAKPDAIDSMVQEVEFRKPRLKELLPAHLSVDRFAAQMMLAIRKSDMSKGQGKLRLCEPKSLFAAFYAAAEMGIDPSGTLGHGWVLPFKRGDSYEATFIAGYRGYITKAVQSGACLDIRARLVFQGDEFEWEEGLDERLVHRRCGETDPTKVTHVYAVALIQSAPKIQHFDVLTRGEVDAIRARSKASESGPWVTDYGEMARKTAVRRLIKYLAIDPVKASLLIRLQEVDGDEVDMGDAERVPVPRTTAPVRRLSAQTHQEVIEEPEEKEPAELKAKTTAKVAKEPPPPEEPKDEPPEDVQLPIPPKPRPLVDMPSRQPRVEDGATVVALLESAADVTALKKASTLIQAIPDKEAKAKATQVYLRRRGEMSKGT